MKILILFLVILLVINLVITRFFYLRSIDRETLEKRKQKKSHIHTEKAREDLIWFEENTVLLTLISDDNEQLKLSAYTKVNEGSNKWAVLVHGYTTNAKRMASYAKEFYDRGFNILLPDLRGHGLSEGKYIGMGIKDSEDIVSWCKLICSNTKDANIMLLGTSMGAATVMNASALKDLPKNVKVIIEDCGFTSAYDQLAYQLKDRYHLPKEPIMFFENLYVYLKHHFSYKEYTPISMVAKTTIPMMFIHGKDDAYVPFEMMDKLYDACNSTKCKLAVPCATHNNSLEILGDKYFDDILNFVSKYM